MSIVTIQVGQCGNQVGKSFFDTLLQDFSSLTPSESNLYNNLNSFIATVTPYIYERVIETFFQRDYDKNQLIANSILVDMEPKVV